MGCVGKDVFSDMLVEETLKDNVDPIFEVNEGVQTGKCAVLLNNKDRCLVPVFGAAQHLSDAFVTSKLDLFSNATILFSEVYFFYAKPDIMHHVYEHCNAKGVKTCLTLSAQNAVSKW